MIKDVQTRRISSFDRTGGNRDWVEFAPGETKTLAEIPGHGSIRHFYFATLKAGKLLREMVLRMYWNGEQNPSVEVPLGDFFLAGHGWVTDIRTTFITINTGAKQLPDSHGFNEYFPMPFARGARITLENQGTSPVERFWYHVEYELTPQPPAPNVGYFHAQWRRQNPTPVLVNPENKNRGIWPGVNKDGKDNYVILEAEGKGRVIGLALYIDNVSGGWYGEGDDMIFIDGDQWPPAYHGTGTEEIFGAGASPQDEYVGPYTGFLLCENRGGERYKGKVSMFRWYIHDPIRFSRSIRWTIEHGHANNYENDYASVAYWYQLEPHKPFSALIPVEKRMPRQ